MTMRVEFYASVFKWFGRIGFVALLALVFWVRGFGFDAIPDFLLASMIYLIYVFFVRMIMSEFRPPDSPGGEASVPTETTPGYLPGHDDDYDYLDAGATDADGGFD